jgi:hypothetical protein
VEKHKKIMGMIIYLRMQIALLIFAILLSGCAQKKVSSLSLCEQFYELNKGKNFQGLFDVGIGDVGRVSNEYDEKKNKYHLKFKLIAVYDTALGDYFTIRVFRKNASLAEQDSAFQKISPKSKMLLIGKLGGTHESLFDSYVFYVNKIYDKYYSIKTPKHYSNNNVALQGNPSLGKFIEFKLTDNVLVYYVDDFSSLNSFWSEYFKTLKKLGDGWFCEITEESKSN